MVYAKKTLTGNYGFKHENDLDPNQPSNQNNNDNN